MRIVMCVASHKPYWVPEDAMYLPLQVGSLGRPDIEGFQRDDTGEHISARNPSYCELTGLYWAWKNVDADYIGLVHYRRHFAGSFRFDKKRRIATREVIEQALARADVILPAKRRYVVESNYSQYVHAHHEQDLTLTHEILCARYPDYLAAWDSVMRRRSGHRFNIFVMKKPLLDAYLSWLFDVLFALEQRLDVSGYTGLDTRVFGLVSERLLDVWLAKNPVRAIELPIVNLEPQHWPRKIAAFLKRKFTRRTKR